VHLEKKKPKFSRNEIVLENCKVDEYKRVRETERKRMGVGCAEKERRDGGLKAKYPCIV